MKDTSKTTFTCGCYTAIFLFNLFIGGWSVNYLLQLFGKDIPFLADILIGLFVAEFSIPVAVVVAILKSFGVF
jgi:hypothetical protein